MKIPVGNFGYSTPAPQQAPNTAVESQAIDRLGQAVSQVGQQIDDKQQELARAKDLTAYQAHALQVDQLTTDYKNKIASGEVPFDQAQQQFTADAQKIPAPQATARGPVAAENMNRGVQLKLKSAQMDIAQLADVAHDKELQSQGVLQLDALGKRAGLPGANIDSINAQADAVAPVLRSGGLSEAQVSHTLQDFKDRNWFNQAQLTAMQSRDSLPKLTQLEHDLTAADGFYANRMDTDKRNAVLSQVITHRMQLENRMAAQSDKREAAAETEFNRIQNNIASGVPIPAEMWSESANVLQGTSLQPALKQLQTQEVQVQNMLRQPIAVQQKFVQDAQSQLDTQGGDSKDRANLKLISDTVNRNIMAMQKAPLLFIQNRTGQTVEPLDMSGIITGDTTSLSQQLTERVNTLKAARKQFGPQIPLRPLLPQEANQLATVMNSSSPEDNEALFAVLRKSFDTTEGYVGAMQQIAPDSPVKAQAGALAAKDAQLQTTHWFTPNVAMPSTKVAQTILRGDAVINPSKDEKSQDGKPKLSLYVPNDKALQQEFSKTVGTGYALAPDVAESDFQAVKAYYVGRAVEGKLAKDHADVDTDLVKEAVRNVVGNVVDYNGKGQVIAPWGMDAGTFKDRAKMAILQQFTAHGLDHLSGQIENIGLMRDKGAEYMLTVGNHALYDPKTNEPITINVSQPMVVGHKPIVRGRGVVGSQDIIE